MVNLIKNILIQNAMKFRYIYFGIILTIFAICIVNLVKDIYKEFNKKDKLKNKLINIIKNKYLLGIIFLVIVPNLIEIVLYKNYKIQFELGTYIRLIYIYALYFTIYVYKVLKKNEEKVKKVLDFCTKHRYKIAIIIFAILVLGKVHTSSIGIWNNYIREGIDSTVFGTSRAIRSDEWLVTTPFNLSQFHNGFKLVNDNLNIGNNDMNIYHAPVLDLSIIVRIFSWGYILFGNEMGIAWAWMLKIIAMFMIFFELGMIITKKDKLMSLMASIWLSLSPAIMWWSVMGDIIFAMAIVVLFHTYLKNGEFNLKKKLLIAYGMIVFLCQFAYLLYPAWEIPLAYIMLVFIIVDFIKYRKNLNKRDYIIMICTILITALILGYFVITSWSGIQGITSTKYPGGREETGGDFNFNRLVDYYVNFFTPYTSDYENPCEMATFIYPTLAVIILTLGLVLSIIKNKKIKEMLKEKDNWYIFGLLFVLVLFLLWMGCVWPVWLRKITGLFTSPTKRTGTIFSFGCVIFTIIIAKRYFDKNSKLFNNKIAFIISTIISIIACVVVQKSTYANTITTFKLEFLIIAIFAMNYTLLSKNKKAFAYTMIILSLILGAYVNPICIGIDAISKTEIAQTAVNIAKEDKDAIWIGGSQINAQYLAANGIKVLNGINEYPNYEVINKLDPEHEYEEVWNRYAHIAIKLSDSEETRFDLISLDSYFLTLTYNNLKELNIKYYYTDQKVEEEKMKQYSLETLYENDNTVQYIYKIN